VSNHILFLQLLVRRSFPPATLAGPVLLEPQIIAERVGNCMHCDTIESLHMTNAHVKMNTASAQSWLEAKTASGDLNSNVFHLIAPNGTLEKTFCIVLCDSSVILVCQCSLLCITSHACGILLATEDMSVDANNVLVPCKVLFWHQFSKGTLHRD